MELIPSFDDSRSGDVINIPQDKGAWTGNKEPHVKFMNKWGSGPA